MNKEEGIILNLIQNPNPLNNLGSLAIPIQIEVISDKVRERIPYEYQEYRKGKFKR